MLQASKVVSEIFTHAVAIKNMTKIELALVLKGLRSCFEKESSTREMVTREMVIVGKI